MKNIIYAILFFSFAFSSCYKVKITNNVTFKKKLSDYNIYSGNVSDIKPNEGFHIFEVTAQLFSNYAKKQRLFKIPDGQKMINNTGGLADFPNGTILVKTFYYYNDERDTSLGKKIIETRLLIKKENLWNVAAYEWNKNQTDADLRTEDVIQNINWINKKGENKNIIYIIPKRENCAICHQVDEQIKPIGPNMKYMNFNVERNGTSINQLEYFQNLGLLNNFDHTSIVLIPDYKDVNISIKKRGRSYLNANCAFCHKPGGYVPAANRVYKMGYETELTKSRIDDYRKIILEDIEKGKMPYIGVSVIDEEGVKLMQTYLNSL